MFAGDAGKLYFSFCLVVDSVQTAYSAPATERFPLGFCQIVEGFIHPQSPVLIIHVNDVGLRFNFKKLKQFQKW